MEQLFQKKVSPGVFTKFVAPSVVMMLVIGLYYTIDSIFVSNFVGSKALASLTIVYPLQGLVWGMAIMLAAGSSAIVAIKMGEKRQKEANRKFTLICIVALVAGLMLTILGLLFVDFIVTALGATKALWNYCVDYASILILAIPAIFLSTLFEHYVRVNGRPGFALLLYVISGIIHLVLDYVFIVLWDWGIKGAAWATFAGLMAATIIGGAYFIVSKDGLAFIKTKWDGRYLVHSMINGSSEMVSEASDGIAVFFFNMVMIRLAGENGVAALSIIFNAHFMLLSMHIGYITGVAPMISYFYGAKEFGKVNHFLKYSRRFTLWSSLAVAVLCFLCAELIVEAFGPEETEVYDLAVVGLRFLSGAFLFTGINIFASGFFTAYGNGEISALISLSNALVMMLIGLFTFSWLFGIDGVWYALVFSDAATVLLSFFMFHKFKDKYHYNLFAK